MRVPGMTGAHCERQVVLALEGAGAEEIAASARRQEVVFVIPTALGVTRATQAVRAAGFKALVLEAGTLR